MAKARCRPPGGQGQGFRGRPARACSHAGPRTSRGEAARWLSARGDAAERDVRLDRAPARQDGGFPLALVKRHVTRIRAFVARERASRRRNDAREESWSDAARGHRDFRAHENRTGPTCGRKTLAPSLAPGKQSVAPRFLVIVSWV